MMKRTNAIYSIVALHVLIWGALLALPHLLTAGQQPAPGMLPGSFWLVSSFIHIGLFYLNAYVLYPRWLNKRYWWLYVLSLALLAAVTYYIKRGILAVFFPGVSGSSASFPVIFFPALLFLVASIIYRLVVDKVHYEKEQKERQAAQLAMELKFLRSQISPHFLFNVLTNLVSLARKKSDLMEPSLIMLSDLMRYMLYDSEIRKVPLEKEVAYLKSYIALQKLRFGDETPIETLIEVAPDQEQLSIEPMLLIPFVENAFKHGIGWITDPWISIRLVVAENRLTFTVKNKYTVNGSDSKDSSSGIGLANVGTRLKLLYPDQHILAVQQNAGIFSTVLTLQLR
ncbi:sensor histidine kinase [Chitinophaga japonensis]|uniref:Histidine kinase n=1 Tax=Chitinophaga japonensis TaxID=104662 RepID=A0A562SZC5_CHIJA|nr:sensor histidine kinase [Chitinophaga japonensis]TWI86637.1 histidine kinase [Chitinophaga japonensis]